MVSGAPSGARTGAASLNARWPGATVAGLGLDPIPLIQRSRRGPCATMHEPTLVCTELNSQVKPPGRKLLGEMTKLMIHGKSSLEFAVSVKKGEVREAPEL